ncbi:MAG TPA: hypothetical protein DD730_12800 [Desulfosporosinus sp.]|nr:hypothetical protein [Desulfosporosinus sp.]
MMPSLSMLPPAAPVGAGIAIITVAILILVALGLIFQRLLINLLSSYGDNSNYIQTTKSPTYCSLW